MVRSKEFIKGVCHCIRLIDDVINIFLFPRVIAKPGGVTSEKIKSENKSRIFSISFENPTWMEPGGKLLPIDSLKWNPNDALTTCKAISNGLASGLCTDHVHYVKNFNGFEKEHKHGALSIHPKILKISVGTSNGTDHFGLVRPEYLGPALKVVHFDRSGHFGRSDRNVSFHLLKLLPQVPHFCILLTRTSSFQWKVKCCE